MSTRPRGPYRKRNKAGNAPSGNQNAGGSVGGGSGANASGVSETPGKDDLGPPITLDPTAFEGGFTDPVNGPQTPESRVEPSTGETLARPRGRPAGSTNRAKIKVSGVEALLLGIHNTLHTVFGIEEFSLKPDEARELATAYADVADHYPVMNFDPKYAAIANFAGVVSIVYGSRLLSLKMRRAMQTPAASPLNPMPNNEFVQSAPSPQPPQQPPAPGNGKLPEELRESTIPGVGKIVFDPSHPLVSGKG